MPSEGEFTDIERIAVAVNKARRRLGRVDGEFISETHAQTLLQTAKKEVGELGAKVDPLSTKGPSYESARIEASPTLSQDSAEHRLNQTVGYVMGAYSPLWRINEEVADEHGFKDELKAAERAVENLRDELDLLHADERGDLEPPS